MDYYSSREDYRKEVAELLNSWSDVARNLGNKRRADVARLQSIIFQEPYNCDSVINEYKKLISPEVKNTIEPLFCQWKTFVANRYFADYGNLVNSTDTWFHWLVDAELESETGKGIFWKKLSTWLNRLKDSGKLFKEEWTLLSRLTRDLPDSKNMQTKYPTFYKTVINEIYDYDKLIIAFCRRELQRMNAGSCLGLI